MKKKIDDPFTRMEIEKSLKTKEDWEYWEKVKKNNESPIIWVK